MSKHTLFVTGRSVFVNAQTAVSFEWKIVWQWHAVPYYAGYREVNPLSGRRAKGANMNKDTIEGNWKELKGKVKEQWGKLTDDRLDQIAGKREQLAGEIQQAYGVTRDEADKQIKDFEDATKH